MTSFVLKIFALIFMLADHIALVFPNFPACFHWIGRLAAPIFLFCSVWSFHYTRNKEKYLLRLYIASVIMAISSVFIFNYFPNDAALNLCELNIFRTLFTTILIIYIIEMKRSGDKRFKKYLSVFIVWQIASISLTQIVLVNTNFVDPYLWSAIFGNILVLNGGLFYVILGIVFYYTKNNNKHLAVGFSSFVAIYSVILIFNIVPTIVEKAYYHIEFMAEFIEYTFWNFFDIPPFPLGSNLIFENYQWMMIFALPFMLAYNNRRGKSFKYLFYVFYPAHIFILYFIACLVT